MLAGLGLALAGACSFSPDPYSPRPRAPADADEIEAALPPDAAPDAMCDPIANTNDSGHHNSGADCMSCHNGNTAGAPKWFVAGTIYTSAIGGTPIAGATIHVRDANGQQLTLVSALNGNFYTSLSVVYPLTVSASACPNAAPMLATVAAPGGCNSCHLSGGTPGRVRLP
ncbi:MAG TPA: hypothetical protein VKN99_07935 [Polyangia bacterium]|nr:hypothetical protein [Polyangia bacterium]